MSRNWAYLMLCGPALFWSGNFILGRAFASDIGPITLSYWRWLIALLIFLPFSIKGLLAELPIVRAHLLRLTVMGALAVSGFNTFVYLGLQHTSATNALLINSFIPFLIILLSSVIPGISIRQRQIMGVLVSTAGMILVVTRGDLQNLQKLDINRGDLWMLLAALCWATYSISLRWRPPQLSATSFLLVSMILGLLILSPFYWLNVFNEAPFAFSLNNLVVVGYIAIFASIGAFLLWNQGVKVVGAGIAGQFIHLMPIFGSILAIAFLGEQLFWFHVCGALAIGGGIYLSVTQLSRRAG
jgi:drug/metabolite transporter (DMT)-like permease